MVKGSASVRSSFADSSKALDAASADGWIILDMKKDRKSVVPA